MQVNLKSKYYGAFVVIKNTTLILVLVIVMLSSYQMLKVNVKS